MAVNIDKMDAEIRQALDIYLANTQEDVKTAVEETAKETVDYLNKNSPRRKRGGGTYAKNWAWKRDPKIRGMWRNSAVVYNKAPTYRLTHLLERGHATRNGGRVEPAPHISTAEETAHTILYAKLVRKLRYRD